MTDYLYNRLQKVKALYLRASTPGERRAAGDALLRIYRRIYIEEQPRSMSWVEISRQKTALARKHVQGKHYCLDGGRWVWKEEASLREAA